MSPISPYLNTAQIVASANSYLGSHFHLELLDVQDKVYMLGHVDDIVQYYKAASVFVMPSITRAEAFGLVQSQAMAAGIPVINTDIPSGVPEVSVHGQTGFTVPPKDPDALAKAINQLLDNEELPQQFGREARIQAHDKFSMEKIVKQSLELYETVMAGSE